AAPARITAATNRRRICSSSPMPACSSLPFLARGVRCRAIARVSRGEPLELPPAATAAQNHLASGSREDSAEPAAHQYDEALPAPSRARPNSWIVMGISGSLTTAVPDLAGGCHC